MVAGPLLEFVAADILARVEATRLSLRHVMEEYFSRQPGLAGIRGVVRAYLLGLLRRYRVIDAYAEHVLGLKPATLDVYRRALLRSIVYEAKFRDVDSDRLRLVLRHAARRGIRVEWGDIVALKSMPVKAILKMYGGAERLGVEYSLPTWVVEYLLGLLGREAYRLFKAFNRRQPLWIRSVRPELRGQVVAALRRRGFTVEEDPVLDDVAAVHGGAGIARTPEYRRGLFVIQERASSLAAHLTGFRGVYVDVTSAPGVKIMHFASRSGYGVGVDIKRRRVLAAVRLASRLGLRGRVDFVVGDSRLPPLRGVPGLIVDPDCSSLGRLGVSPEMRLWVRREYVDVYSRLQWEIVSAAARVLRPGGRMVYSTCTLTLEENEHIVRRAVEELGFEAVEAEPRLGVDAFGVAGQRLYPHVHGTIGFFAAVLERR